MKIAFFGAGQIGGALIEGLLTSGFVTTDNLYVKGGHSGTAEALQSHLGFHLLKDMSTIKDCDVVVIATIPRVVPDVLKEIKEYVTRETIVISIASSPSNSVIHSALGADISVAHGIPNTPIRVLAGMTPISFATDCGPRQKQRALDLFNAVGSAIEVDETLLTTFGTVAGCSPAFIAVFMEALADAAVANGIPRNQAYQVVAQTVLGTATLAAKTGMSPATLKDEVCSPGGSTIQGVVALEKNGLRFAVMDAVNQANHAH